MSAQTSMYGLEVSLNNELLILDGGMSRELMRLDAPFRQPEWSALALIESPHLVQQVHTDFAEAGADIITTNSYALVPFHIGEERFSSDAERLAALSGQLAKAAASEVSNAKSRPILVAGCLPPVFGSYRPDLFDAKMVQKHLRILVEGLSPHVDLWLGETLSLVAEAEAVAFAVKDTGKPLWISFTLEDKLEYLHPPMLRSGELVVQAVSKVVDLGASAILFNCSEPEVMNAAIEQAVTFLNTIGSKIRVGAYANAFESQETTRRANEEISAIREDLDIDSYASVAQTWVNSGATIVGGCCGIGRNHIQRLAETVKHTSLATHK